MSTLYPVIALILLFVALFIWQGVDWLAARTERENQLVRKGLRETEEP